MDKEFSFRRNHRQLYGEDRNHRFNNIDDLEKAIVLDAISLPADHVSAIENCIATLVDFRLGFSSHVAHSKLLIHPICYQKPPKHGWFTIEVDVYFYQNGREIPAAPTLSYHVEGPLEIEYVEHLGFTLSMEMIGMIKRLDKNKPAAKIQKWWRRIVYDPFSMICRKKLLKRSTPD